MSPAQRSRTPNIHPPAGPPGPISWRALGLALGLGLGLAAACGDSTSGDDAGCEAGYINCACLPDASCYSGLVCRGLSCVPPSSGSASGVTSDGSAGTTGSGTDGTDSTDPTTGATNTTNTSASGGTTSGSENGGPVIVDFGTNVKVITEGEAVIFTATITDPDGPDDIQGGSLKSLDESITYGAFADLGNGTYQLNLAWSAIDQAIGIEFEGSETVDFKAVFFDNGGKKGFASTSIDLTCGDEYAILACDGHCVHADIDEDECGSCGNVCDVGDECWAGTCLADWGQCQVAATTPYNTCSEYCAAQGELCVDTCEWDFSVQYWPQTTDCSGNEFDWVPYQGACDEAYYLDPNFIGSAKCCCTSGAVWPGP